MARSTGDNSNVTTDIGYWATIFDKKCANSKMMDFVEVNPATKKYDLTSFDKAEVMYTKCVTKTRYFSLAKYIIIALIIVISLIVISSFVYSSEGVVTSPGVDATVVVQPGVVQPGVVQPGAPQQVDIDGKKIMTLVNVGGVVLAAGFIGYGLFNFVVSQRSAEANFMKFKTSVIGKEQDPEKINNKVKEIEEYQEKLVKDRDQLAELNQNLSPGGGLAAGLNLLAGAFRVGPMLIR
jgi:hypothetical protein